MRKTFLNLFILFGIISVNAQTAENPFAKYGFKKIRAYSFSKGEFEEFHDNKEIVEIGSVLFDTKTNQVIGYVNEETENEVDAATSAMTVDPLCEKYPWISPYTYCLNNPVKFIDPDGRVVRLANNTAGALNNLARIAATSQGEKVLNQLISHSMPYTLEETFWASGATFNADNRTITYGTPWFVPEPGRFTTMTIMGHEMSHAYEHSSYQFGFSNSEINNNPEFRGALEQKARSFENSLRDAYSISPLRPNDRIRSGSDNKITNFQTLGNNTDKTSFGFSYTKTAATYETRQFGNKTMSVKTGTTTNTYYMLMSTDKNKNVTFKIYDDYEAYKKATENW